MDVQYFQTNNSHSQTVLTLQEEIKALDFVIEHANKSDKSHDYVPGVKKAKAALHKQLAAAMKAYDDEENEINNNPFNMRNPIYVPRRGGYRTRSRSSSRAKKTRSNKSRSKKSRRSKVSRR